MHFISDILDFECSFCPPYILPVILSSGLFHVHDAHGIRFGKDVHVDEILGRDGEFNRRHRHSIPRRPRGAGRTACRRRSPADVSVRPRSPSGESRRTAGSTVGRIVGSGGDGGVWRRVVSMSHVWRSGEWCFCLFVCFCLLLCLTSCGERLFCFC